MAESLGYDSLSPSVSLALDQDLRIDVNSYLSDLIDMEYRGARQKANAGDDADEQSFEQLLAKVRRMSSDFSESGVSPELAELAKSLPEEPLMTRQDDSRASGSSAADAVDGEGYPSKTEGHTHAEGPASTRRASRRARRASRNGRGNASPGTRGRRTASHKSRPASQSAGRGDVTDEEVPRRGRHRRVAAEPPRKAKRRSRHASPKSTPWYASRWSIILLCAALMALTVVLAYL
ncbi:hypothetical protein [Bifidobacterium leontopitheci]|uniref:Uncharacterized protein n=1 Tax=Bifidobacterium leontopitheci TaxID=2650774 RepID=A0A6I1GPR1_9BIFI|nr:hypothetical protein [Bifidobacterium leontopitheci]KAB7791267.1 hypothetical protein F7D09_0220 [Bifidobacterium leontopitheci]